MSSKGNRCGTVLDSTNPYDTGGTFIPKNLVSYRYDSDGNKLYYSLYKLAIRSSYSSKQRAFNEGKYSFEHIQTMLQLSNTVFDTSKLFWGIILKTDILKRGGNRRGMKACCVFYSCIVEKQQRSREEIANAFSITGTNDFTKGEKIFREIFEKNKDYAWILYKNSENEQMYSRYISHFGLPFKTNNIMKTIKTHCKDHFLGVAAKSEIAGILYYTVKDVMNIKKPNKTDISKHIGVCNPTLTKVLDIIKYFYSKYPDLHEELVN
jgi:transcription initiation factor TFIIIB Brf1 subunit/transcription initiation factor TFIIB